jgi:hypothetical protein
VVGGVDRLLNQVIGPGPDRFDAVTEVIDLGCPWYLVLLGFDVEGGFFWISIDGRLHASSFKSGKRECRGGTGSQLFLSGGREERGV